MKLNLLLLSVVALVNAAAADPDANLIAVDLGTAGNYAILAKTGISTVPQSAITGDIAVSPIAGDAMTGFSFAMAPDGASATSTQVTGTAYAADYTPPTPSTLSTAVSNMETAYTNAAGRTNDDATRKNVGNGNISGKTLSPGIYTFTVNININDDVTLSGSPTDVFIIQATGNLVQAANKKMVLVGGVLPQNIFWQIAGHVTAGAGAHLEGILLVKTAVTFLTGSSLNGRVLAQTACNLQMATITEAPSSA
jgi:hypothetical protein